MAQKFNDGQTFGEIRAILNANADELNSTAKMADDARKGTIYANSVSIAYREKGTVFAPPLSARGTPQDGGSLIYRLGRAYTIDTVLPASGDLGALLMNACQTGGDVSVQFTGNYTNGWGRNGTYGGVGEVHLMNGTPVAVVTDLGEDLGTRWLYAGNQWTKLGGAGDGAAEELERQVQQAIKSAETASRDATDAIAIATEAENLANAAQATANEAKTAADAAETKASAEDYRKRTSLGGGNLNIGSGSASADFRQVLNPDISTPNAAYIRFLSGVSSIPATVIIPDFGSTYRANCAIFRTLVFGAPSKLTISMPSLHYSAIFTSDAELTSGAKSWPQSATFNRALRDFGVAPRGMEITVTIIAGAYEAADIQVRPLFIDPTSAPVAAALSLEDSPRAEVADAGDGCYMNIEFYDAADGAGKEATDAE